MSQAIVDRVRSDAAHAVGCDNVALHVVEATTSSMWTCTADGARLA